MKKLLTTALAAAFGLLPTAVVIATASAPAEAREGCVTRNEFKRTKDNWTLLKTEAVYDTHGRVESQGEGWRDKSYPACWGSDDARVSVTYLHHHDAWRVTYKWYTNPSD